jgi:hypothetical protein
MEMETEPATGEITRRDVLARMDTGLGVLTMGGPWEKMSPAEAQARDVPLRRYRSGGRRSSSASAEADRTV